MLEFEEVERLAVSVVVVTYGGGEWAIRSLGALLEATDVPFEVIAVDNASPDGTGERLADEVRGITLLRNERNVGFAPAVNQGAGRARAPAICLLNPDTLVRPGWAGPLLAAVGDPLVGAAVPLYLHEDGTVQEAGSVVDRQGWTETPEAGLDPGDPRVRARRVVDYGSAACLMMRREVFHRVGGLDARYAPAYLEDVDLAMALGRLGLRVVVVPASRVVHAVGVSSDPATRERLIERNRDRFLEGWAEDLADRPPLEELDRYPHRLTTLRDVPAPIRILVLLDGPVPPAIGRLMEAAAPRLDVRVIAVGADPAETDGLLDLGVEVAEGEPGWFSDRRLWSTAVVAVGKGALRRFEADVDRTQPQAEWVGPDQAQDPEALLIRLGSASPAAQVAGGR